MPLFPDHDADAHICGLASVRLLRSIVTMTGKETWSKAEVLVLLDEFMHSGEVFDQAVVDVYDQFPGE